jgi:hypothetical protein
MFQNGSRGGSMGCPGAHDRRPEVQDRCVGASNRGFQSVQKWPQGRPRCL